MIGVTGIQAFLGVGCRGAVGARGRDGPFTRDRTPRGQGVDRVVRGDGVSMSANNPLRSTVLACCVVAVLGAIDARGEAQPLPGEDDPATWVVINGHQALDRVLALERPAGRGLPRDVQWLVSVRILPTRRAQEVFTLTALEDGQVRVTVRQTSGASLSELMTRLHAEHPGASVEEIADLVPVDNTVIMSDTCPALKTEAKQFLKLRLSTSPQTGMVLHGASYEFLVAHWLGFRLEGRVNGDSALGDDQDEPIASWAEHLRGVVKKCGAPLTP
jgi:hypothetical protein